MSDTKYIFDDGGRSASKTPKEKFDCVVRAVSIAMSMNYDECHSFFKRHGRENQKPTKKRIWQAFLNGVAKKHSFPSVAGRSRMTLAEFCRTHSSGKWIVQIAKHVIAVVDGAVHDISIQRGNACVYAAWERLTDIGNKD